MQVWKSKRLGKLRVKTFPRGVSSLRPMIHLSSCRNPPWFLTNEWQQAFLEFSAIDSWLQDFTGWCKDYSLYAYSSLCTYVRMYVCITRMYICIHSIVEREILRSFKFPFPLPTVTTGTLQEIGHLQRSSRPSMFIDHGRQEGEDGSNRGKQS